MINDKHGIVGRGDEDKIKSTIDNASGTRIKNDKIKGTWIRNDTVTAFAKSQLFLVSRHQSESMPDHTYC